MIKFGVITMLILVCQAVLSALVLPPEPTPDLILEQSIVTSRSIAAQPMPEVIIDISSMQDTIHFAPQLAIMAPGDQCYADFNQRVLHESL